MLAIAYGVTGNAAAAADVVQEGFLRAWQRAGELREAGRFGAWVGQIVRRLAVDAVRRGPRRAEVLDGTVAAPAGDPVEGGSRAETASAVADALATLDEVTRSAVVLRYFEDLPSRQIGELLGLSPAAVDMRLSRARALLRDQLAAHAMTAGHPASGGQTI